MLQLTLIYVRQVFSKKVDMDGYRQTRHPARLYLKVSYTIELRNNLDVWKLSEEYPSTQTSTPHILPHLSAGKR